jgi:hypothetical protein
VHPFGESVVVARHLDQLVELALGDGVLVAQDLDLALDQRPR